MTKRHRALLFGLPLVLLATMRGAIQPVSAETAAPTSLPAGTRYTVTLLTGDVVTVVPGQSGCPHVSVKPTKPSGIQLRSCGPDGHARVVPIEAAPLLGSVLDEKLFDVTALIQEGYDDAKTKELPLIVRREAGTRGKALASIDSVAVRHPKGVNFLQGLTRASTKKGGGPLVRLDRRVHVTSVPHRLDRNLEQVSAPQAWQSGYTGRGVKVAVLDTGADFTHPDLVGQVVEQADFVYGDDAVDRHGHGTHVAATIAGTGAAARGERKGVAPDAKLVIGKVLDDNGFGFESDIIAGMEWAAPRSKVVNMSLGGWEPSDGTDPMSEAVNSLSAKHGTLFVVAAGNEGPGDRSISWPAAASAALTVGAVDADDKVAEFSSRGPVINTHAAKPELVAPGVDIIAARAAGTGIGTLIDDKYTAVTGTSMAAPHTAGGAAILAQRYPQWTGEQLKSALVGAADPLRRTDTYLAGSGRLNVARALTGVVSKQPIVNLGAEATTAKLAWTEPVQASVTATDRHGKPTPSGAVTLAGNTITVNRTGLAPGFYTAIVTAKSRGSVAITPVTFYVEPPMVSLELTATKPPNSTPDGLPYGFGQIVNLDDPAIYAATFFLTPGGEGFSVRIPAGRYSIMATVGQFGPPDIAAMVGDPDITVTSDTAFVLDAAKAKPVRATIEGADTVAVQKGLTYQQTARRGNLWFDWAFAWGENAQQDGVLVGAVDGVGIGKFETYASFGLDRPGTRYDLIRANGNGFPADPWYHFTKAEQANFIRIDQRFHLLDRTDDTSVGHKRYGISPAGIFVLEDPTNSAPPQRVDYLSPGYTYIDEAFYNGGTGIGDITQEAVASYRPGSRHLKTWVRQPLRPDWYDDPNGSPSGCVPNPISRTRGNLHVELVPMTDQHNRFSCTQIGVGQLTLHRNGNLVGSYEGPFGDFTIPSSAATYRLTYDVDATDYMPVSTRVTTAWTFQSRAGTQPGLLSVDYALPLDDHNHPVDGKASFTVRQAHSARPQHIKSLVLWVSTDDGKTWRPVTVRRDGKDTFSADLPRPAAGQYISLRVKADGSAGSEIDQTIIRAYR